MQTQEVKQEIQPFSKLESKHWGGEGYYKDGLLGFIYTEGIKDFALTYNATWLIQEMMMNKKIRGAKDMVYPALIVDDKHYAHVFFDCDHAELGKDKPLFSIKDVLEFLPVNEKLNFEFSPWEQILILMSEH